MILFIDIETAPCFSSFDELSDTMQYHWRKKTEFLRLNEEEKESLDKSYRGHAGIYAEFSRVICIGIGYYHPEKEQIQTTSVSNTEEKLLLTEFTELLHQFQTIDNLRFCGHNIKEFDLPFLCRRMTVHQLPLPEVLNLSGLKPWENNHVDTMELWRFGDYKRYTSLDLLANILGVSSSKEDMDGSMVADVFYEEKDLPRIIDYCIRDVVTTAKVYYKLVHQTVKGINE